MNLDNLPAPIFAPVKMAYLGYLILTGLRVIGSPSKIEFLLVTMVFIFSEVYHNDYLRIRLNRAAESAKLVGH